MIVTDDGDGEGRLQLLGAIRIRTRAALNNRFKSRSVAGRQAPTVVSDGLRTGYD